MNPKIEKIVKEFTRRLKSEVGKDIDLALLYGSAATDDWLKTSDVDILIISPKRKTYDKILDIQTEVGLKYGVAFSILFETPREVQQAREAQSPFLKNIIGQGEVLYENSSRRVKTG